MATRNPQTMAKRAREQAVREKRELKRARKAEAAAARRAAGDQLVAEPASISEPGLEDAQTARP